MSLMPLSFSRLSTFETCEAKFEYLYVTKRVVDAENEFTAYGTRVHSALEQYGRAKLNSPEEAVAIAALEEIEASPWLGLVDKVVMVPGEKYFEHQMALTRELTPCDWFAPDVWLRGIADVLVVNDDKAYCLDWKTGKVKENPTQLQLFAAMVFAHFPDVQEVKTSFVWLAHGQTSDAKFHRNKVQHIWNALMPRLEKVQEAVDLGVFRTKPSGLCRYCPAREICGDAR